MPLDSFFIRGCGLTCESSCQSLTCSIYQTSYNECPQVISESSPIRGVMKGLSRNLLPGLSLCLLLICLLNRLPHPPPVLAEEPPSTPTPLPFSPPPYTNDAIFEQLSGAAQSLLEQKYGPKPTVIGLGGKDANPTAAISRPGSAVTIGPLSTIDNILVNNPNADATTQDTQSETAIIRAGSTLVAAWNDSGSAVGGAQKFTGFGRSTDGGLTWTDGGTLPTNASGDAGDPVLAYHTTSDRVYLTTLAFTGSGLRVFRSNNAASSWLAPVEGAPGFGGGDFLDKPWLTVDNFAGTGNGNVYLIFRNFAGSSAGSLANGIYLTKSTNDGASFGPTGGTSIVTSSAVQGSYVLVGSDHSVYVLWYDQSVSPRQIRLRRSTDFGATFGSTITVAQLLGTGTNGALGLNGGFRSNSFVQAAVNPVNGHLYVVFNDDAIGVDKADIFFTVSINNGTSWSAPVRVNSDTTINDQFFPAIAVTPDGTRLAVTFYDRRLDPTNNLIDRFGVVGSISGGNVSFGPNFLITTQPFPVVIGVDPRVNLTYMGDYDMMAADNNFFYTLWSDNRDQSLADPSRNNANIRFARFPVTGPGANLRLVSAGLAPGCGNRNGTVDLNECNLLQVVLQNVGSSTATGVNGVLVTGTTGVTITQSASTYSDIAPGAVVTNTVLFQFATSLGLTPGMPIDFNLNASTAGDGVFNFPFQLTVGTIGTPQRFDNNTPLAITDLGTITSTLAVSGISSAVGKVTVSLHLAHTFDADLDIFLIGPDGTSVELSTDNSGDGDNYGTACAPDGSRTTFDDNGSNAIAAATAPFAGTFRPEVPLAAFNKKTGPAVNGVWSLRITDDATGDSGNLLCWSLFISPYSAIDARGAGCTAPLTFLPIITKHSLSARAGYPVKN